MNRVVKRMAVAGVLAVCLAASWALPSVQDVQSQVQAGHYAEAEQSMAEVVAAKPGSAKAHYLYAEILAHNGRFDAASKQAKLAREADPKIGFTDPAKFRAFERLLEQQQHPATAGRAVSSGTVLSTPAAPGPATTAAQVSTQPAAPSGWHVPGWAWFVGAMGLAWLAWRAVARTFAATPRSLQPVGMPYGAAPSAGAGYGQGYGPGYNPGYGPTYGGPAPGGSALRTGLAVAGGVAAGMALDEMLHRGRDISAGSAASGESHSAASGLAPGMQPGFFDDDNASLAADELERRDIDFGNAGGWDAGGSDDSGGDVGGGSSDGW